MKTFVTLAIVLPMLALFGIGTSSAAPTLTVSAQTTTGFTISWSPVAGATAYSVWVEPVSVNSGGLASTATSWTFTRGTAATTYIVKLDALVNGKWTTAATTTATTASVAAPTLSVSNVTASGFGVDWSAVPGASGYSVWVEPVSVNSGLLTGTSWAFTKGAASTTYTVKLDVRVSGVWKTLASKSVTTAASVAPPPDSSAGWTLVSPQAPVTTISNPSGLGLNINNQAGGSYRDTTIDGGGDSSILLQGTTNGVTLNRFRLTRTAANPTVSWAKHGIYAKAWGNTFTDIYADNTGGNGVSGFSVRMGGNTFERTIIKAYTHSVTYYEHDGVARTTPVTFRNGDWTFTGDTAVWGDDSNEPPSPYIKQSFVFENINAHGPSGAKFLKFGNSYGGSGLAFRGANVTIKNCTINGRPVTTTDISGIPTGSLTIQ